MYKILKNIIEMDDYSVQKLSKSQPPEPFEWNTVEGTELNVSDCIGGKGKIAVKGNTYQAEKILPEGYTQVDYIESHGEEYIDTGVNADSNLRVVLDIQYNNITNSNNTNIGAITKIENLHKRYHLLVQSNYYKFYISSGSKDIGLADTNRHTFDFNVPNQSIKVDSTEYTIGQQNFDCELNFWLFGRNSNVSSLIFYSSIKLYRSKMYYNGSLVRDLIPCYRNSDNEVGLYDLVNNVFYTNDGTGAFTYGSVVSIPNPDYPQEVKVVTGNNTIKHVGKNLFDKNNANILNNVWISTSSVNTVSGAKTLYIPCKKNTTYTISRISGKRFTAGTTTQIPQNAVPVSNAVAGFSDTSITITTDATSKYLVVFYYLSSADTLTEQQILDSIQIEESSTATEYEPYKEKTYNLNLGSLELCKIENYQDVLFKNVVGDENYNAELESGTWYKEEIINKVILDGSYNNTTLDIQSTNTTRVYFTNIQDKASVSVNQAKQLSNLLICASINNVDVEGCYAGSNKTTVLRLNKSRAGTTKQEINSYLSQHPITIYYPIQTPTYTKITDQTLISQLEALTKAKWFKGVNYWWTETNNLEPVLKGTYRQAITESEV